MENVGDRISVDGAVARFRAFAADCIALMDRKRPDYTQGGYATRNFDVIAERSGASRFVVWNIYFQKHMVAIESYLRGRTLQSEPIEERIKDAINYLLLLVVMIEEEEALKPTNGDAHDTHIVL